MAVYYGCLKSLSPTYMVECSEGSELMFEKLLTKLVEYKKNKPSVADQAKFEFSRFMSTLVKENRDEFIAFRKETDRLDESFWRYIRSKYQLKSQRKLFLIVLVLSHGQPQVERKTFPLLQKRRYLWSTLRPPSQRLMP